ncbi:hypothetical protein K9N68_39620 (plasmid) [Kovacikia minuta CCNUW1]|uniref:hypothetical protein n=1 Tax=Kovacikia minuta TaxID=2931930 RepID=UPI001CCEC38D|nr:hypothetical protein [Kovacikia minuta]UBF30765.1 hypothetical protein K9N68_39620 [Kovacikia minuta CCNUW1]
MGSVSTIRIRHVVAVTEHCKPIQANRIAAPFLKGDDFKAYRLQFGDEEVLRQTRFAYEWEHPLSGEADEYLHTKLPNPKPADLKTNQPPAIVLAPDLVTPQMAALPDPDPACNDINRPNLNHTGHWRRCPTPARPLPALSLCAGGGDWGAGEREIDGPKADCPVEAGGWPTGAGAQPPRHA